MPNSTSNSSKSQSPRRTRTPTPTPSKSSDSSIYADSKGTKIRILSKQSGATIHQLGDWHVLKFGRRVKRSEAAAMKLVLKETDILLPEWLAEDFPCDREEGYLWMILFLDLLLMPRGESSRMIQNNVFAKIFGILSPKYERLVVHQPLMIH
jgi:hypothetical protein